MMLCFISSMEATVLSPSGGSQEGEMEGVGDQGEVEGGASSSPSWRTFVRDLQGIERFRTHWKDSTRRGPSYRSPTSFKQPKINCRVQR